MAGLFFPSPAIHFSCLGPDNQGQELAPSIRPILKLIIYWPLIFPPQENPFLHHFIGHVHTQVLQESSQTAELEGAVPRQWRVPTMRCDRL